jgi:hypothetical protein
VRAPSSAQNIIKKKHIQHNIFVVWKEPGDSEPIIDRITVGVEALEKSVDVRKNPILEDSQTMLLSIFKIFKVI